MDSALLVHRIQFRIHRNFSLSFFRSDHGAGAADRCLKTRASPPDEFTTGGGILAKIFGINSCSVVTGIPWNSVWARTGLCFPLCRGRDRTDAGHGRHVRFFLESGSRLFSWRKNAWSARPLVVAVAYFWDHGSPVISLFDRCVDATSLRLRQGGRWSVASSQASGRW